MFRLFADAPEAAAVFDAATSVLAGTDPRAWVLRTGDDEIHANRMGQILCCTQALAAWAVVRPRIHGPLVIAGYSVGELAAWGVAGLIDADRLLRLAAKRADLMNAATPQPAGLLAVSGLQRSVLAAICERHGAYIAIINARDRMIVGGSRTALAAVAGEVTAQSDARTTLLPVTVASHTPLLREASEQFRDALHAERMAPRIPPGVRLLSGIDGDPVFELDAGADKLAQQIQATVNWAACMSAVAESGAGKILELGPGNALARMMRDVVPEANVHGAADFHTLTGLLDWIDGSRP